MNGSQASGGSLKNTDEAFDSLISSEGTIFQEGYKEGVQSGSLQGNLEGWSAGLTQGGRIGLELGNYVGFCSSVSYHLTSNPSSISSFEIQKFSKLCEKIQQSIAEFPVSNVEGEDLMLLVSQIRGQVSHLKNSLKLSNPVVGSGQKFSF